MKELLFELEQTGSIRRIPAEVPDDTLLQFLQVEFLRFFNERYPGELQEWTPSTIRLLNDDRTTRLEWELVPRWELVKR